MSELINNLCDSEDIPRMDKSFKNNQDELNITVINPSHPDPGQRKN